MDVVTNVNMVGVEASVLIGWALDWAVEQCELISKDKDNLSDVSTRVGCSPSTNWVYGGPIIERELIQMSPHFLSAGYEHPNGQWEWRACLLGPTNLDDNFEQDGPTPLIAAMRCHVASKLGKYIYIPEVLKHVEPASTNVKELSIAPTGLPTTPAVTNILPGKVRMLVKNQVVAFYPCSFSTGKGPMWFGVTNALTEGVVQLYAQFRWDHKTGDVVIVPGSLHFLKDAGEEGGKIADMIYEAPIVDFEYDAKRQFN